MSEAYERCSKLVNALRGGSIPRATQHLDRLRDLYRSSPDAETAEQMAIGLECFLDVNQNGVETPGVTFPDVVQELAGIVEAFPVARGVAIHLASGAAPGLLCGLVGRDESTVDTILTHAEKVLGRFPGDEDLAFTLARALVNATLIRADRMGNKNIAPAPARPGSPSDPVLSKMGSLLEIARANNPSSAAIQDACDRFRHATGHTPAKLDGSTPPAPGKPPGRGAKPSSAKRPGTARPGATEPPSRDGDDLDPGTELARFRQLLESDGVIAVTTVTIFKRLVRAAPHGSGEDRRAEKLAKAADTAIRDFSSALDAAVAASGPNASVTFASQALDEARRHRCGDSLGSRLKQAALIAITVPVAFLMTWIDWGSSFNDTHDRFTNVQHLTFGLFTLALIVLLLWLVAGDQLAWAARAILNPRT